MKELGRSGYSASKTDFVYGPFVKPVYQLSIIKYYCTEFLNEAKWTHEVF